MAMPLFLVCYSFIDSFIHSFIHSLTHSFIHSFIHSFTHSLNHSFIHSFIHSFTQSFIHSFIHSLFHSFTQSFIHSFIHSNHARESPVVSIYNDQRKGNYSLSCLFIYFQVSQTLHSSKQLHQSVTFLIKYEF